MGLREPARGAEVVSRATSRRALVTSIAVGEAALDLLLACGCELAGRPNYERLQGEPFSVIARSFLPEPVAETAGVAKAALDRGEAALDRGEYEGAVKEFTFVLEVAPTEYKLCQRGTFLFSLSSSFSDPRRLSLSVHPFITALLKRTEAYRAVGDREGAGRDFRQQWLWGRGLRWPGACFGEAAL